MRDFARNWLPLLFNAFIGTDSQQRNSYAAAIAAYATIAEPATLSHFFREVIKKLLKARLQQLRPVQLHVKSHAW